MKYIFNKKNADMMFKAVIYLGILLTVMFALSLLDAPEEASTCKQETVVVLRNDKKQTEIVEICE